MGRLILKAPQLNAQPGIRAMLVSDSKLWGGTYGAGGAGRLFQWDDLSLWVQKAGNYGATADNIFYLLEYGGEIFAASGETGKLLEYDSVGGNWDLAADKHDASSKELLCLIEFDGDLCAGEQKIGVTAKARLLVYDSVNNEMDLLASYGGAEVYNNLLKLVEFGGELYGCTTFYKGMLLKWDGANTLDKMAILPGTANILNMIVFDGKIYGVTGTSLTTYPGGELIVYNPAGAGSWDQAAPQLNNQDWILALVEWRGEIWAATATNGHIIKWNGTDAWIKMADTYGLEIWNLSMVVYKDRLFIGGGVNGVLLEYVEGQIIIIK